METTESFGGLHCTDCGRAADPLEGRCDDCGGALAAAYDGAFSPTAGPDMWANGDRLPFDRADAVSLGEGGTPLVECPSLAAEAGVGRVLLKDEGANPTGSAAARGASLAVTAASFAGADDVALPTTGDRGQAVAAYAARADIGAHVFAPSRMGFVRKAMINVHGGEMRVVEGRYGDAAAAAGAELDDKAWRPLGAFDTPYHHEAARTVLYEVAAELGAPPDAVVQPTGHGVALAGLGAAAQDLDEPPALYAAQPEGCAPVVHAIEGEGERAPWDAPDSIVGELEVPDPEGATLAADAVRETDGAGVAVADDGALESATVLNSDPGVEAGMTGGVAAGALWERADDFDDDDTVVLVNPTAGSKDADVLRSHLMGQGV
jgi:threonine synthase